MNRMGQKKIFISYLQLTASVTAMDIPWPANYLAVFRAQALASSVGEEFMDIRCAMAKPISIASIEYGKMLTYALIPFLLVFLAIWFWYNCGRRLGVPEEKRNAMMTGTIVLLLYLLYPSIAAKVLGLWKCRYMDGIGSIFIMDPQVLCDDSSHLIWQNAVGVPCILLYILGLPLFALCLMYKFRHKLHEQNTSIRIGLLYDGFKPESYMHEFFVVLRKVLIIVIAIFEDKVQVLLCLGVVGMLLTHTVMTPFQTEFLTRLEIFLLSCSFLTLWVGGIFVVYPGCHSRTSEHKNPVCVIGEASILVLNIVCLIVGLGSYGWLSWKEKRKVAIKAAEKKCGAISFVEFGSAASGVIHLVILMENLTWTANPANASAKNVGIEVPAIRGKKDMEDMDVKELEERAKYRKVIAKNIALDTKLSKFTVQQKKKRRNTIMVPMRRSALPGNLQEQGGIQTQIKVCRLLERLPEVTYEGQDSMTREVTSTVSENIEHEMESTWFSLVDKASGRTYYCNKNTNEVQWERPEELHMEIANPLVTLEQPQKKKLNKAKRAPVCFQGIVRLK